MFPATLIRRYTNASSLIHMLQRRRITLLDPMKWDDRNDAHFIEQYRAAVGARSVLALCFAQSAETYHHWRIYSHGMEGVCVDFDKAKVTAAAKRRCAAMAGDVRYHFIKDLDPSAIALDELPFIKRKPYEDEREYRLLHVSRDEQVERRDVPIRLDCIDKVTLSPWLPYDLGQSFKKTLRAIPGCAKLKIVRSTLVENKSWKSIAGEVAGRDASG